MPSTIPELTNTTMPVGADVPHAMDSNHTVLGGSGTEALNTDSGAVGQVETLEGSATVIRSDGAQENLSVGAPIFEGDQIQTTDGGNVGMVFQDGSKFAMAEDGQMRVDALIYNPTSGSGTAMFNVSKGVFAFVSGEIAKSADDAMTVETPVATIGIRGTTVVGRAGSEGEDNSVTLLPDADGHLGEIAITNNAGSVIVTDAYQSVFIGGNGQSPTEPRGISPGEVKSLYGDVYDNFTPANDSGAPTQKDSNATREMRVELAGCPLAKKSWCSINPEKGKPLSWRLRLANK